jgi:hypothetical protein
MPDMATKLRHAVFFLHPQRTAAFRAAERYQGSQIVYFHCAGRSLAGVRHDWNRPCGKADQQRGDLGGTSHEMRLAYQDCGARHVGKRSIGRVFDYGKPAGVPDSGKPDRPVAAPATQHHPDDPVSAKLVRPSETAGRYRAR